MRRTAFGTTKNRVLVGETYSTNNDSAVLASIMAKHKQNGLVGYSDNNGTIKSPRFEGNLIGNANTSTRANTVSYTVGVNATNDISAMISDNIRYLNSDLYLTTTSESTILTIISPNATGVSGLQYKIYNTSLNTITLKIGTGTGIFSGKYGSNVTTLFLPDNTWVQLNSNGMNWLVVDRSVENQNYTLTTSGDTFPIASTNYQYGGAKLYLTSNYDVSGTFNVSGVFDYPRSTFTIPSASNTNSLNQTYTIYNNSPVNNIRLSSDSSFIGQYQNNESPIRTSDIGVNSSLIFYSNGTSWVVTSGSSTLSNLQIATGTSVTIVRADFRRTNVVSAYNNANYNVTIPIPVASDVGLDYFFTRLWGKSAASTVSIAASATNPIINGNNGTAPIVSSSGITSGNSALARITARQTGYAGSGTATFKTFVSDFSMNVTGQSGGFIYYNTVITATPNVPGDVFKARVNGSRVGGYGIGEYTVAITSGQNPNTNYTYTIAWGNTYTWVSG